jgi:Tfp pilus assembly PilM family ATPase
MEDWIFLGEITHNMFGLLKKHAYPIGVDVCNESLRLVQLENYGKAVLFVAGSDEKPPADITAGSSTWQRWAIEVLQKSIQKNGFQGKDIIAGIPADEIFIDHIKMPKASENKLQEVIFSKIKQKLPFDPVLENTMLKYLPTDQENIMVMAIERTIIDRHLAIYERAGLSIRSIGVWPMALVNCYTSFFGRRKSDLESIVMLVLIEQNHTNAVICRHKHLLFARSISMGFQQLIDEPAINQLVFELTACKRQFGSMHNNAQIERLIFLSSRAEDRNLCATIAKQMEMPAQIGDCLAAVKIPGSLRNTEYHTENPGNPIDRRNCQVNWATAFGMSLS